MLSAFTSHCKLIEHAAPWRCPHASVPTISVTFFLAFFVRESNISEISNCGNYRPENYFVARVKGNLFRQDAAQEKNFLVPFHEEFHSKSFDLSDCHTDQEPHVSVLARHRLCEVLQISAIELNVSAVPANPACPIGRTILLVRQHLRFVF